LRAHLIGVYAQGEMPEELAGFVSYHASRRNVALRKGERIAVLQAAGTSSYLPIFVERVSSMAEVEAAVLESGLVMDHVTAESMARVLEETHK
jgi:hypothetical protein